MQDYLNTRVDWNDPLAVCLYDELPYWSALFGELLFRNLPLEKEQTVLDLGCGAGFPLFELAQCLGRSCSVYGLDPWRMALERAVLKKQAWQVPNAWLVNGSAEQMPFTGERFDLVVSNLGLNNFEHPILALHECRRVLRPGGRLAITTNLQGHMVEFYEAFAGVLDQFGKTTAQEALRHHIDHRTTLERLTGQLEQCGFRVSRVIQEPFKLRFADGSAMLRHHLIKVGFMEAWKGVLAEGERAQVFAELEGTLNQQAMANGELSLTIPGAYVEAVTG